ncbi:NAD(P)-binding protein [Thozetella sp. PMI_491]|nr:NAD(P)-binding protein [Thozetella sp. PMI_491]
MAPRVLYIGLGNIGRGMSKNLVEKGNLDQPLLLYNRSSQRSIELQAQLGTHRTEIVNTVAEGIAKADVVFLCLSNDTAVDVVVTEILQSRIEGKLIIDCSTVHPDTSNKIGQALEIAGADFVASPVFGPPPMAEAGKLVTAPAGPERAVKRALPYFKGVTTRDVIDMSGEKYGTSTLLKLMGSSFIGNMVEQVAESLVLAEKTGLGTSYLHQWISLIFGHPYSGYSERMVSGNYYQYDYPPVPVDVARKDLAHILALSKASGAEMPNIGIVAGHIDEVKRLAGEKGDLAGIYGILRVRAGLDFENQK